MYNTDLPARAELPSTGQLLRSTAVAALIAGGLLVTTVLPAEYGIDPTGVGRALGLARMGEIKRSLATGASVGETPTAQAVSPATVASAAPGHEHGDGHAHAIAEPTAAASPSEPPATEVVAARQNTVTVKLKPGEAAEIKLAMRKDRNVRYEWSAAGGPVNFDTHGDPSAHRRVFITATAKVETQAATSGRCRPPLTASTAGTGATGRVPR